MIRRAMRLFRERAVSDEIRNELLLHQYKQSAFGAVIAIALVLVSIQLFYDFYPQQSLLVWALPLIALLLLTVVASRRYMRQRSRHPAQKGSWNLLLLLTGLTGMAWGFGAFQLFPGVDEGQLLLVVALLSFVAMGGIVTSGSYFPAFLLFSMPIMASQVYWLTMIGGPRASDIAELLLLFTLFIIVSALIYEHFTRTNIRLRFRNLELIDSLHSYHDALEHTADAVAIFAANGCIDYVNPAFELLSGASEQELSGRSWERLFADMGALNRFFGSEASRSGNPWQGDMVLLRNDGSRLDVAASFSPVISKDGHISHFVSMLRDVGEQERNRKRSQKIQQMESLAVLAGGVAHDFNNLLTSILGSASLLRVGDSEEQRETNIGRIENNSRRAAELCSQMLAYTGQGRLVTAIEDINAVLSGMEHEIGAMVSDHAELSVQLAHQSLPAEVDHACLTQVVSSLVRNAVEAADAQRPNRIEISTGISRIGSGALPHAGLQDELPVGDYLYLSVADCGEGMDTDHLLKVFNPFYSTRFCGRGLGLPSSLGLVRSMKGSMAISSTPGEGTCVSILLPLAETGLPETTRKHATVSGLHHIGGGCVLIADDDEALLPVATQLLEHMGFRVLQAHDADQVVSLYRQHGDEVVALLIEQSMPGMDCGSIYGELEAISSDVSVIFSSANPPESDAPGGAECAGFRHASFLQKPYSPEQLEQRMLEVMKEKMADHAV